MDNYNRNYSIDFVRGIAIFSVIFLHNLPTFHVVSIAHIGQAVPLFLLITAYLSYLSFEKGKTVEAYYAPKAIKKMLKRIVLPFLIVTIIQYFLLAFLNREMPINTVISNGGIGPGSYYPWLYLQTWLFLPLIIFITKYKSIGFSSAIILLICIFLEWLSCYTNIDPLLYRLLFYRYLFVIYLGCLLKKENWEINKIIGGLAIISLLFSLVEVYSAIDFEPFFTSQWKGYHWITSFYPLFLFLLGCKVYSKIEKTKIAAFFVKLGNYTYEIFLCQMFVYSIFSKDYLSFIDNYYLEFLIYIAATTVLSRLPILLYKQFKAKLFKRTS